MKLRRMAERLAMVAVLALPPLAFSGAAAADPPLWRLYDDYASQVACFDEALDHSHWTDWECMPRNGRWQLWYRP
jgi:hypothetical protein